MRARARRFDKLLGLHATLEALGEARRAGHLAAAHAARQEAEALVRGFDDPQSLSALFPALYHARIGACLAQAEADEAAAIAQARKLAELRLRAGAIGRARDAAHAAAERGDAERLALDWVEGRQAAASSEEHSPA